MISPPYIVYIIIIMSISVVVLIFCKVDNKLLGLWELMEQDFNIWAYFIFQVKISRDVRFLKTQ